MPTLLQKAKTNKQDEFYTQLTDIENELKYYKEQFRDKVIFCNCDDPFESNFPKFFLLHKESIGWKELIATSYAGSSIVNKQLCIFDQLDKDDEIHAMAYCMRITNVSEFDCDKRTGLDDISQFLRGLKIMLDDSKKTSISKDGNTLTILKGDGNYKAGDFRSSECITLLKECDIVCTNPPFSLFREFMMLLALYEKEFLIIGNQNAVTYAEVFPLIKDNKLWYGESIHSGDREFKVPLDYVIHSKSLRVDSDGNQFVKVSGVRWFTNLDIARRHFKLNLYKKYSPEKYPKYWQPPKTIMNVPN
jgi:hypothetical protein